MIRLDSLVQVVACSDEFTNKNYLRRNGVVEKIDTTTCGATPKDPFFIVRFKDGFHDGFWKEELREL